ncbi:hypothetical protein RHGRI_036349 [Rhododendron griersonianum]|uniref:Myb-like domain-containing protein n=1 Tax=Rhododendron griersonianum TaxID=479676 RepID=A0AAV6HNG1_9ERIC|nr:hypothetical protein RHGRI_036349 [Rhododendron griersonianum]
MNVLSVSINSYFRNEWKMIKDEAFGNDSKRTRTDLRDKWKTLVHTATIPAHERRGAVPPEWLLEIVRGVKNGF